MGNFVGRGAGIGGDSGEEFDGDEPQESFEPAKE